MTEKTGNTVHEDIFDYIRRMRYMTFWFGDDDYLNNWFCGRYLKIYKKIRWAICILMYLTICTILYFNESFGLYDGTFVYGPLFLMVATLVTITSHQGRDQLILANSLNRHFLTNCEPWMINMRHTFLKPIKKFVKVITWYNIAVCFNYLIVPLVIDAVLHFGFDSIESHLLLPLPFTPIYGKSPDWGWKFYSVTFLNTFACFELVQTLISFISSYGLLTSFYIAELKIFKERVKSIDLFESADEVDRQIKEIVLWHNSIIVVNKNLKIFFGLPCAFLSQFTSVVLTLALFTSLTSSDDIPIVLSYGGGMCFYAGISLFFNSLGQMVENEGDEIFWALYNLPWHQCKPGLRKTINMMIRQARAPLNIDYHGRTKMNLANFMQVLRSAYSYFAVLQSMAT
ncbi:FACT complex subunit SSRP1 [Nesidiocoris tenuis]|uniref:Odorant receptor n=1 Tax=Nesidiocoris tenuis TaxID=355587 RepID=A0ABN7BC70_9HEMI|nr:FACT complex subunit SSRP1 [Nesidiocoris tenuis]